MSYYNYITYTEMAVSTEGIQGFEADEEISETFKGPLSQDGHLMQILTGIL